MRVVITGGAGFIGSNLVDGLLDRGDSVVVIDDLRTGQREFLDEALMRGAELLEFDVYAEPDELTRTLQEADAVVHLAANADVRFGWDHPRRDLEQNVIATHNVLEAMRLSGVQRLLFSSTGSVYGEATVVPTPEDCPFPVQTSLYGASKSAAEGLIAAYAEQGLVSASVFRFVSILGPRYTHGHVIDFVAQLTANPAELRVLGDGTQRKSYLHVSDCTAALISRLDLDPGFECFNLGTDEYCQVRDSITWICDRLGVVPDLRFSGGDRGWPGDNPFIFLDTAAIREEGWAPKFSIREAIEDTVDYLQDNPWVLAAAIPPR